VTAVEGKMEDGIAAVLSGLAGKLPYIHLYRTRWRRRLLEKY
jgi:hypothetical protein